jgi:hypothetical protein
MKGTMVPLEVLYSPSCLEQKFCEVLLSLILRSSRLTSEGGIMLAVERDAPPRGQRGNPRPMKTRGG